MISGIYVRLEKEIFFLKISFSRKFYAEFKLNKMVFESEFSNKILKTKVENGTMSIPNLYTNIV